MGQDTASPPGPDLDDRIRTVALVALAVVATGAAMHWLASALVPFALALFLSIALAPLVDGLAARAKVSRGAAVALAMALGVVLVLALGGIVAVSAGQLHDQLPSYQKNLAEYLSPGAPGEPALLGERARASVEALLERLRDSTNTFVSAAVATLGTLLSQGASVLIFLMFLLVEQRRRSGGLAGLLDARVKGYITVKVLSSAATGIGVGVALALLGIDAALLFGLLTFLLNFIPTLGSIIAVLLPLPIVLAGGHGNVTIALALLIPALIQFVVGQLWENKRLGDEFDLRASVVLLALVIWGKLFGLVGMFLATPLTAVLKSILEEWPQTRGLARAMGAASPERSEPRG